MHSILSHDPVGFCHERQFPAARIEVQKRVEKGAHLKGQVLKEIWGKVKLQAPHPRRLVGIQ